MTNCLSLNTYNWYINSGPSWPPASATRPSEVLPLAETTCAARHRSGLAIAELVPAFVASAVLERGCLRLCQHLRL